MLYWWLFHSIGKGIFKKIACVYSEQEQFFKNLDLCSGKAQMSWRCDRILINPLLVWLMRTYLLITKAETWTKDYSLTGLQYIQDNKINKTLTYEQTHKNSMFQNRDIVDVKRSW